MSAGPFEIRVGGSAAAANEEAGERGLHRYCCGCAQETEHVLCQSDDGPNIPANRWPFAAPASGTTMCVDCGQWRVAASRPIAPAWSFWPRLPAEAAAVPSLSKPKSVTTVHDGPLESAAENEGMPPLLGPSRLRGSQPARTMKNPIATY
jgi:hypothetical protein